MSGQWSKRERRQGKDRGGEGKEYVNERKRTNFLGKREILVSQYVVDPSQELTDSCLEG